MTLNIRQIAGLLLMAAAFFDLGVPGVVVPPKPPVVVPQPSISVTLPAIPDERKDAYAQFYTSLGQIVAEDGAKATPQLKDTTSFMTLHASALGFAIKTEHVGTVPGLGDAIDKAFFDRLGEEVKPLDSTTRGQIVEVCNAIAWRMLNG